MQISVSKNERSAVGMEFTAEEQRSFIKIQFARNVSVQEITCQLSEACGHNALKERAVRKWVSRFRDGECSTADLPRSGRPVSALLPESVTAVEEKMTVDRRWTCEELSSELGISEKSIHRILTDELKMSKICARWVPHCLNQEQKDCRVRIARQHRYRFRRQRDNFLQRIITLDETWARCYEPELKSQSAEWRSQGSPTRRPMKFRQGPSKMKVMLIVAYDVDGIILVHSVPAGQNVNADYYRRFLQNHLRPAIRKKRHQRMDDVIILHDNASSHTARVVQELIDSYGWETLPHPPYSPDLSPCDFHLFPAFKRQMRGVRFESLEAVITTADRCIRQAFLGSPTGGIQKLPERWERVIEAAGDYFEGF